MQICRESGQYRAEDLTIALSRTSVGLFQGANAFLTPGYKCHAIALELLSHLSL